MTGGGAGERLRGGCHGSASGVVWLTWQARSLYRDLGAKSAAHSNAGCSGDTGASRTPPRSAAVHAAMAEIAASAGVVDASVRKVSEAARALA